MLKASPYGAFARAFPRHAAQLAELATKEAEGFSAVRAPRTRGAAAR
jgi:hypothetical protein